MCLGLPGKLVEIPPGRPELATVDVAGIRRTVNVGLFGEGEIQPGDWVLVHVGFAISKLDAAEAASTLELLEGIG